ncbi:DUF1515 family protein [Mesorhizobium sp. WSM3626]|uniref:DUF1515 family protein n=1 Tax=Mesorhizobium sp. WSM3626 TaxID=1040987 RepID=UPI0024781B93|nr:DUF1515 family protein [Mesorhizobium sp. WSM3626]
MPNRQAPPWTKKTTGRFLASSGVKDSDARAALSYEQSEQRAASSRAKMYAKTEELGQRMAVTESAVKSLTEDMTEVKTVTAEVTRWKLMGLGALGVTGMAAAALASLVTAYWSDIWRVLRGG